MNVANAFTAWASLAHVFCGSQLRAFSVVYSVASSCVDFRHMGGIRTVVGLGDVTKAIIGKKVVQECGVESYVKDKCR